MAFAWHARDKRRLLSCEGLCPLSSKRYGALVDHRGNAATQEQRRALGRQPDPRTARVLKRVLSKVIGLTPAVIKRAFARMRDRRALARAHQIIRRIRAYLLRLSGFRPR